MHLKHRIILAGILVFGCAILCPAQTTRPIDPTARTTTRPATRSSEDQKEHKEDHIVITHHKMTIAGRTLSYTASTGTMAQKDETGKVMADMFFVAYTLDTQKSAATTRPVTFVFNGGPGAASVWLHLGAAGPRRINLDAHPIASSPPFKLVDNDSTWLDATDLVFIDPVGTGYSRPAQGEKGEQFYGVRQDIESVGSFIRTYITRNQRWPSPKYLAGESYGTTRAAGLSQFLLEKEGISLNGIILISSVLNFQTIINSPGNDLPYPLYLPSYSAIAWYYKKLPPDLQANLDKTLREVEHFAMNDYLTALARGDSLPKEQREAIAKALSRYTSLPVDWILKADLRIDPGRFRKELLADEGKVIGRFDARVSGFAADKLSDNADYDPSYSLVAPIYNADFNNYVRSELNYQSDLPYEVLTERVQPWNFGERGTGYLDVADTLRETILKNPQLRVMFCCGRMDLATPYLSSDYTIDHLDLPAELRKNIVRTYYPAGHMVYHDPASRVKLHENVEKFINEGSGD